MRKRISIFVSGNGTNAENIIRSFANDSEVEVVSVLTNKADAPAIKRLRPLGMEVKFYSKNCWEKPDEIVAELQNEGVDLVVLAGFLAIVREPLLSAYSGRILNIHPSLLPLHGGKGMWGRRTHEAVLAAGERQSGITVHLVSDQIDGGKIVAQRLCPVLPDDSPASLEARVHELEYLYYPDIIKQFLHGLK